MLIQYTEMDLRNKTTLEFRTVFHSPVGVPNSQVQLYMVICFKIVWTRIWTHGLHVESHDNMRHEILLYLYQTISACHFSVLYLSNC